jgi:hypothetical protein
MPYRHDMLVHRSRALKLGTSQPRCKAQNHCQGARLRLVAGPSFPPASMHPAGPEGLRTIPHQPSSTLRIGALRSAASFPKQHLPRGHTSIPLPSAFTISTRPSSLLAPFLNSTPYQRRTAPAHRNARTRSITEGIKIATLASLTKTPLPSRAV